MKKFGKFLSASCTLIAVFFVLSYVSFWIADCFCGRTESRLNGKAMEIHLPENIQIIGVDITPGWGSTSKNVTFKDSKGEFYTLEYKNLSPMEALCKWLPPDSTEKESWLDTRMISRLCDSPWRKKLPSNFKKLISVSICSDGRKDITYLSTEGTIISYEIAPLNPFEGKIVWTQVEGEQNSVLSRLFGRDLSRLGLTKALVLKLPENFSEILWVDFTQIKKTYGSGKNKRTVTYTIKNLTYLATDGDFYTVEYRDLPIFQGAIKWLSPNSPEKESTLRTRLFSRLGDDAVSIRLPADFASLLAVSIRPDGIKDVSYISTDRKIKSQEYRTFKILEGETVYILDGQDPRPLWIFWIINLVVWGTCAFFLWYLWDRIRPLQIDEFSHTFELSKRVMVKGGTTTVKFHGQKYQLQLPPTEEGKTIHVRIEGQQLHLEAHKRHIHAPLHKKIRLEVHLSEKKLEKGGNVNVGWEGKSYPLTVPPNTKNGQKFLIGRDEKEHEIWVTVLVAN